MGLGRAPLLSVLLSLHLALIAGDDCSAFRHLENGRTFFRYGGLYITFTCNPGYRLHGYRTSSCVSRQWAREPPLCVAPGCLDPGSPGRGSRVLWEDGSLVLFSCEPGFRLLGSAMLYCKGERWNGTRPRCQESDVMGSLSLKQTALQMPHLEPNLNALPTPVANTASKDLSLSSAQLGLHSKSLHSSISITASKETLYRPPPPGPPLPKPQLTLELQKKLHHPLEKSPIKKPWPHKIEMTTNAKTGFRVPKELYISWRTTSNPQSEPALLSPTSVSFTSLSSRPIPSSPAKPGNTVVLFTRSQPVKETHIQTPELTVPEALTRGEERAEETSIPPDEADVKVGHSASRTTIVSNLNPLKLSATQLPNIKTKENFYSQTEDSPASLVESALPISHQGNGDVADVFAHKDSSGESPEFSPVINMSPGGVSRPTKPSDDFIISERNSSSLLTESSRDPGFTAVYSREFQAGSKTTELPVEDRHENSPNKPKKIPEDRNASDNIHLRTNPELTGNEKTRQMVFNSRRPSPSGNKFPSLLSLNHIVPTLAPSTFAPPRDEGTHLQDPVAPGVKLELLPRDEAPTADIQAKAGLAQTKPAYEITRHLDLQLPIKGKSLGGDTNVPVAKSIEFRAALRLDRQNLTRPSATAEPAGVGTLKRSFTSDTSPVSSRVAAKVPVHGHPLTHGLDSPKKKASDETPASPARRHRPMCPYPPLPIHGTFLFRTLQNPAPLQYNHYVQYACYPGYTLAHGDVYSYCQEDGQWSGVTPSCLEVTPCTVNNGGCSQLCRVDAWHRAWCHCQPGFLLLDDGRTCRDLDECVEERHHCQHACVNTFGSYKCSCKAGFRLAGDGHTCSDVDECAEVNHCAQLCANSPGSYRCLCQPGYRLARDRRTCADVEESLLALGRASCEFGCEFGCMNTAGSFRCQCPTGYSLGAADGHCIDIDECVGAAAPSPGPAGTARVPSAAPVTTDVNECEEDGHQQSACEWRCVNLPGSHRCICPKGSRLQPDGRRCKDVNECELQKGGCDHE